MAQSLWNMYGSMYGSKIRVKSDVHFPNDSPWFAMRPWWALRQHRPGLGRDFARPRPCSQWTPPVEKLDSHGPAGLGQKTPWFSSMDYHIDSQCSYTWQNPRKGKAEQSIARIAIGSIQAGSSLWIMTYSHELILLLNSINYIDNYTWGFPEMGLPPNHPF